MEASKSQEESFHLSTAFELWGSSCRTPGTGPSGPSLTATQCRSVTGLFNQTVRGQIKHETLNITTFDEVA